MLLEATIKGIRYRKEKGGWGIYATDMGTCIGVIDWTVREGDRVKLAGDWQTSSYTGGKEFRFTEAEPAVVTDPRGLLAYAISMTKGLGPHRLEEIWRIYGAAWGDDRELLFLGGIGEETRECWADTLDRLKGQAAQARTMAWLMGHGCSVKLATAAWNTWEQSTIPIVEADPYALARLPHYGFVDVDGEVRTRMGVADDDPRRLEAALLYALEAHLRTGATAVPAHEVAAGALRLVPCTREEAFDALGRLQERQAVRMCDGHVARRCDWDAESAIGEAFGLVASKGVTP